MSVRLVIVDDHPRMRASTVAILQRDATLEVVGEAYDGMQALAFCRALQPDLVVLDMDLPDMPGLTLVRLLRALTPSPRVLILSGSATADWPRAALTAGVQGYVLKDMADAELCAAIHTVMQGHQVPWRITGGV